MYEIMYSHLYPLDLSLSSEIRAGLVRGADDLAVQISAENVGIAALHAC